MDVTPVECAPNTLHKQSQIDMQIRSTQFLKSESRKRHRQKIWLVFLNGRHHTTFSREEVLFLPFSPQNVGLPIQHIFTSSPDTPVPSAPCGWSGGKQSWTQSVPDLFWNPLRGWPCLPGQHLPASDVNILFKDLPVSVCTNLGRASLRGLRPGRQEECSLSLLAAAEAWPPGVLLLFPGPKLWHQNIDPSVSLASLGNSGNLS